MPTIDDFQHLWNGSEPGWKLQRIHRMCWRLTSRFSLSGPTGSEVLSLRRLLDGFRDVPMKDVWHDLRGRSSYTLDLDLSELEMRRLTGRARQASLHFTVDPIDRGGYLPIAPDGCALIIEDDELSECVVGRMLDAGVRVESIEVD
jgi:hypothetical protein